MTNRPGLGEFEIIARYFRPLAFGKPGALNLSDDAALLDPSPGQTLVATTDTMIAGVHYLEDDPPDLVGGKLLRVNLSDLAAMGAAPLTYLLAIALPENFEERWLARFCEGLRVDQERFGVYLCGGDTTAISGPAVLTVTALGEVPRGQALLRSGAKAGDLVFVSGTIGDGALGLQVARGRLAGLGRELGDFLLSRYHVPEPRIELGIKLRGLARAAIDVSDGLVADLGHICETSGMGAVVEWQKIPLSEAVRKAVATEPRLRGAVLGGGDDFELVFTGPAESRDAIAAAGKACGVAVTAIGRIVAGAGVSVIDSAGASIEIDSAGYTHF